MTDTPMWRVMQQAYNESDDGTRSDWKQQHGYAAELRAVRDYLINHSQLSRDSMDLLAAEIKRAEAGE